MWTVSPILSDVCALFKSREMKGRAERLWASSPACDRERGRVTFNLLQFLQPVTLSWLRNTHTHWNRFTHRKHNKGRWTESEWSVWRTWITAGTSHITPMLAFPTLRNANSPTLSLCDWLDHNPQIGKSLTFKYVGQSWLGAQGDWF